MAKYTKRGEDIQVNKKIDKKELIDAVNEKQHNLAQAAKVMGVSRQAVHQYMKRNNLRLSNNFYIVFDDKKGVDSVN